MSGSAGPSRPLRRGPRHDGSSVRKVYFLHFAAPWPHLVRVSRGIRADTVAKIIMRLACRGAGFLHSAVVTQDEGQEAHPLGAFYLFGALGKNNLSVSKPLRCRETGVLRRLLRLVNRCVSQSVPCEAPSWAAKSWNRPTICSSRRRKEPTAPFWGDMQKPPTTAAPRSCPRLIERRFA